MFQAYYKHIVLAAAVGICVIILYNQWSLEKKNKTLTRRIQQTEQKLGDVLKKITLVENVKLNGEIVTKQIETQHSDFHEDEESDCTIGSMLISEHHMNNSSQEKTNPENNNQFYNDNCKDDICTLGDIQMTSHIQEVELYDGSENDELNSISSAVSIASSISIPRENDPIHSSINTDSLEHISSPSIQIIDADSHEVLVFGEQPDTKEEHHVEEIKQMIGEVMDSEVVSQVIDNQMVTEATENLVAEAMGNLVGEAMVSEGMAGMAMGGEAMVGVAMENQMVGASETCSIIPDHDISYSEPISANIKEIISVLDSTKTICCQFKITRGKRQGLICGQPSLKDKQFCYRHMSRSNKTETIPLNL